MMIKMTAGWTSEELETIHRRQVQTKQLLYVVSSQAGTYHSTYLPTFSVVKIEGAQGEGVGNIGSSCLAAILPSLPLSPPSEKFR